MAIKLLLLKDVQDLGRSGDIVSVKPGHARNFLVPRGLGVTADKGALRMQEKLQEERLKQAAVDRKDAEALAKFLEKVTLNAVVKVDQEGHMYGSVTAHDVANLLKDQQNVEIAKHEVMLKHPIKTTGIHTIELHAKEGVVASFALSVMPEEVDGTEPPQENIDSESE